MSWFDIFWIGYPGQCKLINATSGCIFVFLDDSYTLSLSHLFAACGKSCLRLHIFRFFICLTWFFPFKSICRTGYELPQVALYFFVFFWRILLRDCCCSWKWVLHQVALCLLLDVSDIAFFFCARHIGVLWWTCGTARVVCPRLTTSEILFIALLWVYFRLHFLYFRCNKHVFSFRIKLQARVSATPGCAFYAFRCG